MNPRRNGHWRWMPCAFVLACAACATADPKPDPGNPEEDTVSGIECSAPHQLAHDAEGCQVLSTDYQPRDSNSENDSWPACISDDDTYHKIDPNVSSVARVLAYDTVGKRLWAEGVEPTAQDFTDMRVLFEEAEGLGSRIVRRYDLHYPAPAIGKCEDNAAIPLANPDYCVGSARLQPILTAAFAEGSQGQNLVVNARKIRSAIQWFLYLSPLKEFTTCTTAKKDCDSGWAYYTGGGERAAPVGLSADIATLAPATHDRIFDGVLAMRCWKNLDNESGTSTNLALRDSARTQLDTALLRGMAVIVRQRFLDLFCSSGDYQAGALEELRILVPLLDRAFLERNATQADALKNEVLKEAADIDVQSCIAALDETFPCP